MKKKIIIASISVLMCSIAVAAFDCQTSENGIGDWNVVTLGGFTLAKPISVDLAPTNAPDESAQYSIRCQVIYKDNLIPRPMSDEEFDKVRNMGAKLNSWLTAFVVSEYVGAEYEDLLTAYIGKKLVENLNELFPAYVAERILEMDPIERPDIDTVTVSVEAEGVFREDLIREMRKKEASQESK